VKTLARKKREEAPRGSAPWLNTFADLMNLLLCFFVMLFAFSDVNAEKFNELSISMANSLGIFDGGASAIKNDGQLIASGMTQLSKLGEYFTNTGTDLSQPKYKNSQDDDSDTLDNVETINEAMAEIEKAMEESSAEMYDEVSDIVKQYDLSSDIELNIDPKFQYVQLSLKGSILFDSGKAEIKEKAKPILSKIGDLLARFEGNTIEIVGHTDNVPMSSDSVYKNNNWLSSARALNAAEYLINNKKLEPSKLKYSGRGEYEPVTSNATEAGKAKNRRIEIKIYNEYSGK
jgi:chemotaxis protein MotB